MTPDDRTPADRRPTVPTGGDRLTARLRAAGVPEATEPLAAWRRLHEVEGPGATVLDLYELVARDRGLRRDQLPAAERHALAHAALPDVWPGFEVATGTDRPPDPVKVVEYDPRWPARYESWRGRLRDALGPAALRIEHVGSTAVAGLVAKPTVDVQVSVAELASEQAYVPAIESLGLELRTRDDLHRFFRPHAGLPREVHVHVCRAGSAWERDHVLFRDHLRAHPGARADYEAVKRRASVEWHDDRLAYTDAKSEVILRILAEARAAPHDSVSEARP